MPDHPGKLMNFWQELKHRKVIHLMTVYIAAAFSLLEITDIISGPLNLPGRIIKIVLFIAIAGFPVALVLSWLFKTTPGGIRLRRPAGVANWEDYLFTRTEIDEDEEESTVAPDENLPDIAEKRVETALAKKRKGREKIVRLSSFGIIGIVIMMFLFYGSTTIDFRERDWTVITDFENLTGEEIFDNSLNAAFTLSIGQSRYINVFPRQRMYDVLNRMKKSGIEHIDEETGREIAIREGIGVCIIPGISRVGERYILTSKIMKAETGEIIRSEIIYANNRDEVIERLDQLSHRIRRDLGESRYKISGQDKPLSKVTTSSLDALKQFSLGIENHINLDYESARIHYENAIGLDSGFTAAKASLGNLLCEHGDGGKGREWLEEAMKDIEELTNSEKYSILAFYASSVEGDLGKAIQYEKNLIELYPDVSTYHNNLGWFYQSQGNFAKAAEEYKHALRIDPYLMLTYQGITWIYLEKLVQLDSALAWSKKMIGHGPEIPWGYIYMGCAYVCMDSLEKAEAAFLEARSLDPELSLNQYNLAHVYRLMGKYEEAAKVLEELLRMAPEEKTAHYVLGILFRSMADRERARHHFLEFSKQTGIWVKNHPEIPLSNTYHGQVLTYLGDTTAGREFGEKAVEVDSTPEAHLHFAEFLAVQGRIDEAIDHLEKALHDGYRDLTWIRISPDLYLLHDEERFQRLIAEYFPG